MKVSLPSVLGIPVRFDAAMWLLSNARGLGFWKKIVVGPSFLALSDREKGAVLLHEVGHCKLWHTEKLVLHVLLRPRLLWAVIGASLVASRRFASDGAQAEAWFQEEIERRAPGIAAFRCSQEDEADRYCALCGYGADLASVFRRIEGAGGAFHPGVESRIRQLTG